MCLSKNLFKLPSKVIFCKRCVISNQRPSSVIELKHKRLQKKITINFKNGICEACRYSELKRKIDWKDREKKLKKVLDRFRKSNGEYDVIVPGSGGKDSAYVSHLLKYKYGMNPLTVTWSPHMYTDVGKTNFENWINFGGLDNILLTPNGRLHRYLTKLSFKNILHPFQPFIIGQRIIGPTIALKYNIPLIIYGETGAEYGNKMEENFKPLMDESYFAFKSPKQLYFGGVSMSEILKITKFKKSDFNFYIPPQFKKIKKLKLEVHHMSYYKKWDPQENFYYASKNCGFISNSERTDGTYSKYSSIDDKLDNFHYFTTYIKFGLGRASYDASQEIRSEKITREEGIQLVKLYDNEFPKKYFNDFLEYLGITQDEFWKTINRFRSSHLWFLNKKTKKYQIKKTVHD